MENLEVTEMVETGKGLVNSGLGKKLAIAGAVIIGGAITFVVLPKVIKQLKAKINSKRIAKVKTEDTIE